MPIVFSFSFSFFTFTITPLVYISLRILLVVSPNCYAYGDAWPSHKYSVLINSCTSLSLQYWIPSEKFYLIADIVLRRMFKTLVYLSQLCEFEQATLMIKKMYLLRMKTLDISLWAFLSEIHPKIFLKICRNISVYFPSKYRKVSAI